MVYDDSPNVCLFHHRACLANISSSCAYSVRFFVFNGLTTFTYVPSVSATLSYNSPNPSVSFILGKPSNELTLVEPPSGVLPLRLQLLRNSRHRLSNLINGWVRGYLCPKHTTWPFFTCEKHFLRQKSTNNALLFALRRASWSDINPLKGETRDGKKAESV